MNEKVQEGEGARSSRFKRGISGRIETAQLLDDTTSERYSNDLKL